MTITLNSTRELFVDDYLIDELNGLRLKMHHPQFREINDCGGAYDTIIKDGNNFKRYYRRYFGSDGKPYYDGNPFEVTCYAESHDGINWVEPNLGIFEINGAKNNSAVLANDPPLSHNFSPFLDSRKSVGKRERFKALAGTHLADRSRPAYAGALPAARSGLFAFASEDGIHWRKLSTKPVITSAEFAFDSQNVSFWSELEKCYICYFRRWKNNPEFSRAEIENAPYKDFVKYHLRSISRTTSEDYINWSEPEALDPNAPGEHLYTSQVQPYFRAPHIYLATPTRLMPEHGYSTDIMFMSTRDGKKFDRTFMEAFIRPGLGDQYWGNRANYAALNFVPISEEEMALHLTKGRRFSLRTDGFASLHADSRGGVMITKPLTFSGQELEVNFATSIVGNIAIEIQDVAGKPIAGFTKNDCQIITGDKIKQLVYWRLDSILGRLSDRPVRLVFTMMDADLFSFKFN